MWGLDISSDIAQLDDVMKISAEAPLPDWNEFEFAVQCADHELRCYYDTVTGEVHVTGPFEDDPGERARIDADPSRYLEIRHLDAHTERGWMERFIDSMTDERLQVVMWRALGGSKPFRRFKESLLEHPVERARWFAFRDGLVRAWIEEWFVERDLPVGAPPTWGAKQLPD